jgi:hypothetical protein
MAYRVRKQLLEEGLETMFTGLPAKAATGANAAATQRRLPVLNVSHYLDSIASPDPDRVD